MKNTFMVISFVLLCCFAVGCLQRGEVAEKPLADVEADIQAIKDVFTEWSAAYNAANVDKILSYYADEVVRIPPNSPPAIGKDAIRPAYEETFNKYIVSRPVSLLTSFAFSHSLNIMLSVLIILW